MPSKLRYGNAMLHSVTIEQSGIPLLYGLAY